MTIQQIPQYAMICGDLLNQPEAVAQSLDPVI